MFIDLGARVALTDDQFKEEMAKRRALNPGKDVIPGLSAVHAERRSAEAISNSQRYRTQQVQRMYAHDRLKSR